MNPTPEPRSEAAASTPLPPAPPQVEEYFQQLRTEFTANADVAVSAPLAEFIEVIHLPQSPNPTAAPTTRRKQMLAGVTAFVATTTGKLVLGTAVAAASVGGMHAADVVDVPLLPDTAQAEVLLVEADALEESEEVTDAPVVEDGEAEVENLAAAADQPEVAAVEDAEEEVDEAAEDEEAGNHGAVVSEFARSTELEGCEKGQAIADLASSKSQNDKDDNGDDEDVDAEDAVDEDEHDPCAKKDDDGDDERDDDEDEDSDDDEDEDSDDEEDGDGPPEGKGNDRDAHPGKGKNAND